MRFGRSHAEAHKLPTRREDGVRTAKTSRGAWAEKFAKIEIPTCDPMIYGPVESRRVGSTRAGRNTVSSDDAINLDGDMIMRS